MRGLSASVLTLFSAIVFAQAPAPIERVKITDNDLTCLSAHNELQGMDKIVAEARAAQASGQDTATAGQAAGVAAEVASRTGLFGSIGGLTGHLLGTVATKTAANVAEQQGQMNAAQAAEREKQALARKEHLTQIFLAKGCSASDPSAPGKAPNAAAPVQAPTQAASAPPPSAADASAETLAGKRATPMPIAVDAINPEDLLSSNKTLLIPTAYVTLVTEGRVSATKQSGAFQQGNATARAAANFKVNGIDKAYAQKLAKAAIDNLVGQLRGAGYTVLTYADVKDRDVFRNAAREAGPKVDSEGSLNTLTVAPSDEQLFQSGFAGGLFSEFIAGGKTRIADATLIIPNYVFHAPQAWAEGSRGYNSVSATANVVHGMNMASARATWLGQPVSRMMRGIPGVATTKPVINVSEKVGALSSGTDASPAAGNALSSALSVFGGGNIQRSVTNYELTIDREAFAAGVMNGVQNFNAEVAKVAAAAQ
ncbi:MAG: hypothetical protein JNK59_01090 [Sterolibacteriaceae bacterium]|nr:hypothetical protein [Sterolibacteriaceae bacterium]